MFQGGVDQRVTWVKYDGVGRTVRNGLNFTERGFGVRAALGCSDRGHTAVSQLKPGRHRLGRDLRQGRRALVPHRRHLLRAVGDRRRSWPRRRWRPRASTARIISYDLNYRDSLWKSIGGQAKAREVNRQLAPYVDVMIGNEEDFTAALGFEVEGVDEHLSELDPAELQEDDRARSSRRSRTSRSSRTTLRNATTATVNDWGAIAWADGAFYAAADARGLEIYDRVGGGDSFASGLIYGFLAGKGPQWAVECGAAHGALAMTTPGDTSMATLAEVERVMKGGTARVARGST